MKKLFAISACALAFAFNGVAADTTTDTCKCKECTCEKCECGDKCDCGKKCEGEKKGDKDTVTLACSKCGSGKEKKEVKA